MQAVARSDLVFWSRNSFRHCGSSMCLRKVWRQSKRSNRMAVADDLADALVDNCRVRCGSTRRGEEATASRVVHVLVDAWRFGLLPWIGKRNAFPLAFRAHCPA